MLKQVCWITQFFVYKNIFEDFVLMLPLLWIQLIMVYVMVYQAFEVKTWQYVC